MTFFRGSPGHSPWCSSKSVYPEGSVFGVPGEPYECSCKPAPRSPCLSCGLDLADHSNEPEPANAADLYDAGRYWAPPPPVTTSGWSKLDWIAWITNHGRWLGVDGTVTKK